MVCRNGTIWPGKETKENPIAKVGRRNHQMARCSLKDTNLRRFIRRCKTPQGDERLGNTDALPIFSCSEKPEAFNVSGKAQGRKKNQRSTWTTSPRRNTRPTSKAQNPIDTREVMTTPGMPRPQSTKNGISGRVYQHGEEVTTKSEIDE